MDSLHEYTRLKDKEIALDKAATKMAWELENILAELKREHGVKTLDEARDLLDKWENEERILGKRFRKALDDFLEEYHSRVKEETE